MASVARRTSIAPEPKVVFEVLSEDTQQRDRTIKLADYNATPSIAHYVLIEQAEPLVHVTAVVRMATSIFAAGSQTTPTDIDLPAVSLSLTMSEIYDGLALDDAANGPTITAG